MFVIVQHKVKDPTRFFDAVAVVVADAPPGVHPWQFCPSADKTAAVCLWQAEAVTPVREYIDTVTGDAAENAYFEVSRELAVGLPETTARPR